jgi:hypothetical protein
MVWPVTGCPPLEEEGRMFTAVVVIATLVWSGVASYLIVTRL